MQKIFLVLIALIVSQLTYSQSVMIDVKIDSTLIKKVVNAQVNSLLENLSLKNMEGLSIKSPNVLWKNSALHFSAGMTYETTAFLGMKVSVGGNILTTWKLVVENQKVLVKRDKVTFQNSSSSMSFLDNTITGIIENNIPHELPVPFDKLLDGINLQNQKLSVGGLHVTLANIKLSDIISEAGGLTVISAVDVSVSDKKEVSGSGIQISKNWIREQAEKSVRNSPTFSVMDFSSGIQSDSWTFFTKISYPIRWFWLIPDEIERTVQMTMVPKIDNGDLIFNPVRVDVYQQEIGEFSLINWYIKGQVVDAFQPFQSVKNVAVPLINKFETDQFKVAVNALDVSEITTDLDFVKINAKLQIQFILK